MNPAKVRGILAFTIPITNKSPDSITQETNAIKTNGVIVAFWEPWALKHWNLV